MKLTQQDIDALEYARDVAISNAEYDGNDELVKTLVIAFEKILPPQEQ